MKVFFFLFFFGGVSVGEAISHDLAKMFGLSVWVDSRPFLTGVKEEV